MQTVEELFNTLSPLINYQDNDWDVLAGEADQIAEWIPELVDVFYDTLYAHDQTKSVFQEGERPKVEQTLKDWVASLVQGKQQQAFWDHQWIVALYHVRRGVRNLYMLAMMNRVQQTFLAKCIETYDKEKAYQVFSAFLRISGAVATLIAECYGVLLESSTKEGLQKIGLNPALLQRIKDTQINKMIEEHHGN